MCQRLSDLGGWSIRHAGPNVRGRVGRPSMRGSCRASSRAGRPACSRRRPGARRGGTCGVWTRRARCGRTRPRSSRARRWCRRRGCRRAVGEVDNGHRLLLRGVHCLAGAAAAAAGEAQPFKGGGFCGEPCCTFAGAGEIPAADVVVADVKADGVAARVVRVRRGVEVGDPRAGVVIGRFLSRVAGRARGRPARVSEVVGGVDAGVVVEDVVGAVIAVLAGVDHEAGGRWC